MRHGLMKDGLMWSAQFTSSPNLTHHKQKMSHNFLTLVDPNFDNQVLCHFVWTKTSSSCSGLKSAWFRGFQGDAGSTETRKSTNTLIIVNYIFMSVWSKTKSQMNPIPASSEPANRTTPRSALEILVVDQTCLCLEPSAYCCIVFAARLLRLRLPPHVNAVALFFSSSILQAVPLWSRFSAVWNVRLKPICLCPRCGSMHRWTQSDGLVVFEQVEGREGTPSASPHEPTAPLNLSFRSESLISSCSRSRASPFVCFKTLNPDSSDYIKSLNFPCRGHAPWQTCKLWGRSSPTRTLKPIFLPAAVFKIITITWALRAQDGEFTTMTQ